MDAFQKLISNPTPPAKPPTTPLQTTTPFRERYLYDGDYHLTEEFNTFPERSLWTIVNDPLSDNYGLVL